MLMIDFISLRRRFAGAMRVAILPCYAIAA